MWTCKYFGGEGETHCILNFWCTCNSRRATNLLFRVSCQVLQIIFVLFFLSPKPGSFKSSRNFWKPSQKELNKVVLMLQTALKDWIIHNMFRSIADKSLQNSIGNQLGVAHKMLLWYRYKPSQLHFSCPWAPNGATSSQNKRIIMCQSFLKSQRQSSIFTNPSANIQDKCK